MPDEATGTRALSGPTAGMGNGLSGPRPADGGSDGGPAGGGRGGAPAGVAPGSGLDGPPPYRRRVFAHRGESVAEARNFVGETLTGWGVTERLDDVRLCLSELATNALVHVPFQQGQSAGFTVDLVRDPAGVLLRVRDAGSGTRPTRRRPATEDTSGRGLLLVTALADAWGVRDDPAGKTVWLRFDAAPGRHG